MRTRHTGAVIKGVVVFGQTQQDHVPFSVNVQTRPCGYMISDTAVSIAKDDGMQGEGVTAEGAIDV